MILNLELTLTPCRVLSTHKLLLTGIIIFIKPNSLSQLAAATVFNGFFLLMHIRIEPYAEFKDGQLQFWSLWSMMTSLFLGILLKADMQVICFFSHHIELTVLVCYRMRINMGQRQ